MTDDLILERDTIVMGGRLRHWARYYRLDPREPGGIEAYGGAYEDTPEEARESALSVFLTGRLPIERRSSPIHDPSQGGTE